MELLQFPGGELSRNKSRSHQDITLDPMNLDYDVSINLIRTELNHNLRLKITMKRKLMRSFIEIISPPAMLVFVSWVNLCKLQLPICISLP